ncbi:hypothetical protein DV735_g2459, partial [Chaetothyriales sp. CBS 134920]
MMLHFAPTPLEKRASKCQTDTSSSSSSSASSSSLSALLSTLIPVLIVFAVYIGIFLFLRRIYPRVYAPRTFLSTLPKKNRTPEAPNTLFGWIPFVNKTPDEFVLKHNSIDSYFFLRYLKIVTIITFVGALITWPVLFPVNATGGGGQTELDILSFSNVDTSKTSNKYRFLAHTFIAWIYISFIFFIVTRETIYFINVRQAYLLSPAYAKRLSARTVLFQAVPTEYADEHKIRRIFGDELKNVWVVADTKELEDLVEQRTKAAWKLEAAENALIKKANDARLKSLKKGGQELQPLSDADLDHESGSAAARYVRPKDRPTHRLKPLIGKKVDTINWARDEIARLNPLIEKEQNTYRSGEAKPLNAVFVEFHDQYRAQAAFQAVTHHQPLHMSPRVIGMVPEEVVWTNLGITWKTASIRNVVSIAAATVLIIFWAIPVAVVGAISNINYLTEKLPWLCFITHIPKVILGVVTGLLPVILLSILNSLVPPFFRWLGKLGGKPTLSLIELRCQESFFWFQVVDVFLVTTLSSAASAAVTQIINDPTSVTSLLSSSLPKSSNFYISYIILQALGFAGGALAQIVGLIVGKILGKFLDNTPRKLYNRWSTLAALSWGNLFPGIEGLAVIAIAYAFISPLILGFATIGLGLFWFTYHYNILYVNTSGVDTQGLVYVKALKHTLVGAYVSVLCLIGLLAVNYTPAPLVLTVILLIVMVLYHIAFNKAVEPLLKYLPRDLEVEQASWLASAAPAAGDGLGKNGYEVGQSKEGVEPESLSAPAKQGSLIQKFLRPDIYFDVNTVRKFVPQDASDLQYSPQVERDAYQHPAVNDVTPLLWVARDEAGVSRQEVAHTSKVTPITDEAAHFDDKGKVVWEQQYHDGQPPVYSDKVYY